MNWNGVFPDDLRARRDKLEREVRKLRLRKNDLVEEVYYRDLEALLTELAENLPDSREAGHQVT